MYSDILMDHFKNPRNLGEMEDADAVAEVGNPECGDTTRIYLKIRENRIVDVSFQTLGCAAAIASGSMATEMIRGKTLEEAWKLSREEVADALGGLPPAKLHCSVLAEGAVRKAINNYRRDHGLEPWPE